MRAIKSAIIAHISENKKSYLIIFFVILAGFILGSLSVRFDLNFNVYLKGQANFHSFWNSLKINLRFWLLITLAGLFAPLKILSFIANFFKGFSIGFMIKLLIYKYALKAILLIFIANCLHLFLFLPIAIYFSICAINSKIRRKWIFKSVIFCIIIIVFSAFEGFVVPVFLEGLLNLF